MQDSDAEYYDVKYKDCLLYTSESGDAEKIRSEMDERMAYRSEKQPLDLPSAGSVFKRYPCLLYTSGNTEYLALFGKNPEIPEKTADIAFVKEVVYGI